MRPRSPATWSRRSCASCVPGFDWQSSRETRPSWWPLSNAWTDRCCWTRSTRPTTHFGGACRAWQAQRPATVSPAAACPSLDLKFVVHAGSVVRHRVAGREELAGTDAIIAHRLLKAESPSAAGLIHYILFTDAAVQAFALDPAALRMVAAAERFEHLGELPVHLFDLDHRTATDGRPWTPPRRAPLVEAELHLRAEPMAVWEQLTSPRLRPSWEGIDRLEEATTSGRRGVGTMSACVAHRLASVEEILEWRPFEAFVRQANVAGLGRLAVRYELTREGDSTRLHGRWYGPRPPQRWQPPSAPTSIVCHWPGRRSCGSVS